MSSTLTRRSLFSATPVALGAFLLDPTPALRATGSSELPDAYPSQDADSVRETVSVSHFSLEKVRALVDRRPELANATWDWGFGDWETALGAASHTGNHDIAEYLIENGARPDIFTAAMMGNLEAVKSLISATPGIQGHPGPHGITLRRHTELGGDRAKAVLAYLDEIGGADPSYTDLPLEIDRDAYVGSYRFGDGPENLFEVSISERFDLPMIQRGSGTARTLFHQGESVFHPAGAPSARIHFRVEGSTVAGLEIRNPELVVAAPRA